MKMLCNGPLILRRNDLGTSVLDYHFDVLGDFLRYICIYLQMEHRGHQHIVSVVEIRQRQ